MSRRLNHRQTVVLSATALSVAAWAYACGDGAVEPAPSGPSGPATPATVTVTPATAVLTAVGNTVQLAAEVRDQNGQAMAGTTVSWGTSDLLVAGVSGSGLVRATGGGTATVTATAGSASGTAAVTVAQEVDAVTVSPVADTVALADTVRFLAGAVDANGHAIPDAEFAWASGNTLVAVVDQTGLVTGVSAGEMEIAATSARGTGRARLTVVVPGPAAVVAVTAVARIAPGDTVRLAAEAFDGDGCPIRSAEFVWSSSDTSVARVDASGLVTALAPGRATITAVAGGAHGASEILVVAGAVHRDWAALVAFYNATDGPNWDNSENWLTDAPLREWNGVRTDRTGRVSSIWLGNNRLRGRIPPELGNLANLQRLNLHHNNLAGPIPPELGNLASLQELTIQSNDLEGPIPAELGNLVSLQELSLGDNDLTGPIPPEIGDLANLQELWLYSLGSNNLTGPIPPELANLANLQRLALGDNGLTGPIPPELGNLANLQRLVLSLNGLTGPIPPELGNLANLQELGLYSNSLTGPIPAEIGNLAELSELSLNQNQFTGPLPASFLKLKLKGFSWDRNPGLCAPNTPAFRAWLNSIESHVAGPFCASGEGD